MGIFLFIISFVRKLCCVPGNTFQLVTVYLHISCSAAVCLVDGHCASIGRRVREQTDVIPKTRLHTIDTPDLGRLPESGSRVNPDFTSHWSCLK